MAGNYITNSSAKKVLKKEENREYKIFGTLQGSVLGPVLLTINERKISNQIYFLKNSIKVSLSRLKSHLNKI